MMFPLIITILVVLLIFKDFKKGLIVFGTFFFFLKYVPGIGNMSMFFLCSCVLLVQALRQHRKHWIRIPRPILYTTFLMLMGWLITEFVSGYHNFMGWFNLVVCSFVLPWLMWQYIDSPRVLIRFVRAFVVSFLIIEVYGLFQEVTHVNPLYALMNTSYQDDGGTFRFGVFRINSLMAFSSTFGTFSLCFFFLFWNLKNRMGIRNRNLCLPKIRWVSFRNLLILSLIGVYCSATRSCYIMFVVVLWFVFMEKVDTNSTKRFFLYAVLLVVLIGGYFYGFSNFMDNLTNFISNSAEGSSSDMRENQLEICLYWMRDSPIWGNGRNFIFQVVSRWDEQIYGAESLWFRLLVDYGYVGCITYILWVVSILIVLWKYNRYYIAIPLALFIGKSTSILIDVDFEYFLWMSILLIKCHQYLFVNKNSISKI